MKKPLLIVFVLFTFYCGKTQTFTEIEANGRSYSLHVKTANEK